MRNFRFTISDLQSSVIFSLSIAIALLQRIANQIYSTVKPIWRAVPSIVRIALSKFVVFRSGIFVLAISSILAREIFPTFSFLGLPAPFDIPAAFLRRSAAGGVFVSKVNERSA